MRGFFMLLKLILLRLGPLVAIGFSKKQKKIKRVLIIFAIWYLLLLIISIWRILEQEQLKGLLYLPVAVFPHYLFYGIATWMLVRCILQMWSERVWKRIYYLSFFSTIFGIISENYINPQILRFFFEIFK